MVPETTKCLYWLKWSRNSRHTLGHWWLFHLLLRKPAVIWAWRATYCTKRLKTKWSYLWFADTKCQAWWLGCWHTHSRQNEAMLPLFVTSHTFCPSVWSNFTEGSRCGRPPRGREPVLSRLCEVFSAALEPCVSLCALRCHSAPHSHRERSSESHSPGSSVLVLAERHHVDDLGLAEPGPFHRKMPCRLWLHLDWAEGFSPPLNLSDLICSRYTWNQAQ